MIRTDNFDNLKMDCWTYASQIHKSAKDLDGEEFWKSLNSIGKVNYGIAVEVLNAYFEYLEKSKSKEESEKMIKKAKSRFEGKK